MVHISERAGRYLRHRGGEPSNNLLLAVEPALTGDLRTALLRAQTDERRRDGADPVRERRRHACGAIRVGRADDIAPASCSSRSPAPKRPRRRRRRRRRDDAYVRACSSRSTSSSGTCATRPSRARSRRRS
jgi:hypothetical protein